MSTLLIIIITKKLKGDVKISVLLYDSGLNLCVAVDPTPVVDDQDNVLDDTVEELGVDDDEE